MLESLVDQKSRTLRGNRTLIALRLLLAVVCLFILLVLESRREQNRPTGQLGAFFSEGEVTTLAFTRDGKRLLSGGSDASIRVWDLASGSEAIPALRGHGDVVYSIALAPDEKRLASASADKTVRIFDLTEGPPKAHQGERTRLLRTLNHESPVTFAAWSSDGRMLVTVGNSNPLRIWNIETGEVVKAGDPTTEHLTFAGFLPTDRELITTGEDGTIRLYDVETFALLESFKGHSRPISATALSADGKWLATGSGFLRTWDMLKKQPGWASEGHEAPITAMAFGPADRFITGARDGTIKIWSVDRQDEIASYGKYPQWILALALSPDGSRFAAGTRERTIRIWNSESGEQNLELVGHRHTLHSVYLPPGFGQPTTPDLIPLYLRPEGLVVIIVLILSIFYTLALRRAELGPKLAFLQSVVDIALISVLVYQTGASDSPFVTLYLVSIAAAAFVLSRRGALTVAALAVTMLSILLLAYSLGQIPQTYVNQVSAAQLRKFKFLDPLEYTSLLLLPAFAFFLISYLAANLSDRLAVTRLLHREILEGIGEGIIVLDNDRKVLYSNHEVARMLLLADRLEQKFLKDVLGNTVDESAATVVETHSPLRMEKSYKRSDGRVLPFVIRIIPVVDTDGPTRGLIVVLDDVTAEKKMEELLKHRERVEAMGELSASIAHEIRNPLASIRGAVQEISRAVEMPEDKKILIEIVLSESDRLDHIISDFLQYARMRKPNLAPVDIGQLLAELRILLIARPEARDFRIELEDPDDLGTLFADPDQLRQVFLNLCVNAMQAMEESPVKRLSLRARRAELYKAQGLVESDHTERMNRPGIEIEVLDTGPGVPVEKQRQIFEPFFTTRQGGTGLGLAVVDRIVRSHEGLIVARANPDGGTRFIIWLPTDLNERPPRKATVAL